MLKVDILTRLFLSVILIFVVGKVLGHLLQSLSNRANFGEKNKEHDIDRMIERQKDILRAKENLAPTSSSVIQTSSEKKSETERAYLQQFQDASLGKNHDMADIKNIIALFDSLQWGDPPIFNEIKKNLANRFSLRIEASDVTRELRFLLSNNVLLSPKFKTLPCYRDISKIVTLAIFLENARQEIMAESLGLFESLARTGPNTASAAKKAFIFTFLSLSGPGSANLLQGVLSGKVQNDISNYNNFSKCKTIILKTSGGEIPPSLDIFISKIKDEAFVFTSLSPLAPLSGKNDIEGARRLFGVNSDYNMDEIKKIYKSMANKRHPDKLAARGVPDKYFKIANDNFVLVKDAYEILKNNYEGEST